MINLPSLHGACGSTLLIAVLASPVPVQANGIDCSLRAKSETERTICVDSALRDQDSKLSMVCAQLWQAQPDQRDALRTEQRQWLKNRDACGADKGCVSAQYQSRIETLSHDLRAYQPDATDRRAIEELRQAVEAQRKTDAEFPLEKVIERLRIKEHIASFENIPDENNRDGVSHFPTTRPAGVREDEWRALQKSEIEGGGENGMASYTLLDIDGDGQRDLIINSYIGGTGLFSYVSALQRKGDRFVGTYLSLQSEEQDEVNYLYSLNGRGANQSGTFIRLQGRVYAAWRDSSYGQDDVYLLRPFTDIGKVPRLTVHYRYQLTIPQRQKDDDDRPYTLDSAKQKALQQALRQIDPETIRYEGSASKPYCPVPATATDYDRAGYYGFGAGHYSYESVQDLAVWMNGKCYIGQLVDWFGGYSRKDGGLYAQLWLRDPTLEADSAHESFDVHGKRTAIKVDAGIARRSGDNGM